ncbi:MAG TPA: glutamyl-tRNA reductase [Terriglobia bacterium]|nr:glutamyl-tRNA reductase [Terriglobia bacterium]
MNLALVGINHRTAPVEIRERMNIVEDRLGAAVRDLVGREGIEEGLILSTCNRVEIVTRAGDQTDAAPILRQFLADYHHCDLAPYEKFFYWHRQEEVIHHLFRVASSLDSMILGEPQVLGQIKSAAATAASVGALRGPLNEIVSQALAVAKRVRRETAIGATAVSVSYAAVELARKIFGSLEGKTIFVVGAGKMSELAAKHLLRSGASAIFVSNRTFERAEELARAFHGTAIRFDELFEHIAKADIVICSTAAPHFVIERPHAEKWLGARKNRPMFFVDIAVPRNVDPAINQLGNAFVYDIDDLGQVVEANRKQRQREAVYAEEIVNQEVHRTLRRLAAHDLAPTIVALEERLTRIREGEMERLRGRLGTLSPEQREAVEMLTKSIQNKILHGPITELKDGAGRPDHGALVQMVRKIFGVSE